MKLTRHRVNDMDASMLQKCIDCGYAVSDYRNAVWPIEQGAPQGFPAGNVYISKGNPRMSCSDAGLEGNEVIIACNAN